MEVAMTLTRFPNGIESFFVGPWIGGGQGGGGPVFFVNPYASGNGNGSSPSQAFTTVQRAVNAVGSQRGATIILAPGSYDEAVVISRPTNGSLALTIQGMGGKGDVGIAPTATNAGALVNDADDVTLVNVGLAANGTGVALVNTGARLRLWGCKLENDDGTGSCADMTLGTVAQRAAGTKGGGADCSLNGCEFAWAANGVIMTCTDYGAVTELQIRDGWFHDMDTKHITEAVGSGGSAAVTFASLLIAGCMFAENEAGVAPTNYIDLNADNANSGSIFGCYFPEAINGGKVLVGTGTIVVGSYFTGGINAAQPT
jgi:hypothetical protein